MKLPWQLIQQSIGGVVVGLLILEMAASLGTSEVRQRLIQPETEEHDADWDPNLPYGGKVYLARKKKPDPLHVRVIEVRCLVIFILYTRHPRDVI